ncbi:MAG: DUF4199 domain-containing protein [Cyclobacteriaceae bacterium]
MEETEDVSMKSVAIKYGVINGIIAIAYFLVLDFTGNAGNQGLSMVGLLFTAIVMFLAQKEFIRDGDGFMNYGQGLGLGTLLSLVSAIISSIFTYIYISYINDSFLDTMKEQQIVAMEEQGMSDAQIEQALKMSESFSGPTAILIFGIIGGVFFGFIISLIVSAITKKARPEFE